MNAEVLAELLRLAVLPEYGRHGRYMAGEDARRYAAGEPLVRYHRTLRGQRGWSWLCPEPSCGTWRTGHETEQRCRLEWFVHAKTHPDMEPTWPDTSGVVLPAKRVEENAQLDLLTELEYLGR